MAAAREAALNEARDEYPAAALRGDDARHRTADRMRRRWRQQAAGGLLVRSRPRALEGHCVAEQADDGSGDVLRYRKVPYAAAAGATVTETAGDAIALPAGLGKRSPLRPPPPHRSSRPASSTIRTRQDAAAARGAAARDPSRQHRAPADAVVARHSARPQVRAARQYITRQKTDFTPPECDTIVEQTLAVLTDPRFALLFAPGSRAEVPIVGSRRSDTVAGVVDRVGGRAGRRPDRWLAERTTRPPPRRRGSLAETQARYQSYVKQLALYRAVLMRLYPDRPVRAAFGVDGPSRPGGNSRRRPRCSARQPHHPVIRLDAPRRRPYVPWLSEADFFPIRNNEVSHGRWQGIRREFRGRGAKGDWPGCCRFLGRVVWPVPHDRAGARRNRGHHGRQVKIVKLNVDENPGVASKYGIMSIPTLMIFKNGEMAARQVGAAPKQKLEQWITTAC